MLNTIIDVFEQLMLGMAVVGAGLILAMSGWITYDVLTRYFLNFASPWAFDLSEYALVWITFLGAPWVLLQDRHVRIELLVDKIPLAAQRTIGTAVSIIAVCACLVLTWRTGVAALQYIEGNIMMARIWRIPRIWPYSIIPIGSMLMAVAFMVRLRLYLTDPDPEAALTTRASAGQDAGLGGEDLS